MKSIFNRLLQRKEPEAVLAPKGNRVLSEKEVAVQQEKLQTQRAQESARQRAILTAQSSQVPNTR